MDDLYQTLLSAFKNKDKQGYKQVYQDVVKQLVKLPKYEFSYEKLIPYPEYDDVNFNKKIFQKKEFNRNKINVKSSDYENESKKRCSTTSFSLTPNQRFIKSFLSPSTPYNGLLIYHGVGLGKTCTAISIAEQYHDIYNKKVLVILSSTLVDNFKKQIFDITKYDLKTHSSNLCTGTKYPDMVIDRDTMDDVALEKKINKLISEKYQFLGYKELANIINKENASKSKVTDLFSDRLIIVDEAHNLRNASEDGKTKTSTAFKKMISNAKNVKLVLLTATPMFNSATEIVWILNLLLANDHRPELTKSKIFDQNGNINDKEIIKGARGYVSFMRGENPFAFPFRLFPSINNDQNIIKSYPTHDIHGKELDFKPEHLELIGSKMSVYQKKVYDVLKGKVYNVLKEDTNDDYEANNDIQNTLQASNIVYPLFVDNNQTKDIKLSNGFDESFSLSNNKKYTYKQNIQESKHKNFLSYSNIEKYAPKLKTILDYVKKSDGIVLIYSRYYSSGILPLALALEHIGFLKYDKSGARKTLSADIEVTNMFHGKRPKYIIISKNSDISPDNIKEIEVAKSKNNADGELIKVIIVSKVGTEGIDFKRIREIHLLEPWFNLNRAEQIIGRGVRYCSHIDLPKEKRNVTIYLHTCTYDKKEESVDMQVYRMAWKKQKQISQVERILKETAIDCNLNEKALFYPVDNMDIAFDIVTSQGVLINQYKVGDRDGSYVCGFGPCSLECNPKVQNEIIDITTYDKTFLEDDISLYKQYISALYKNNAFLTYETILKELKREYNLIDEDILSYALDEMLKLKYLVFDKKGKSGYLLYRSNKYIFHNARIADIRISMDERVVDNVTRHTTLPLSELKPVVQQPKKSPKKQPGIVDILQKVESIYEDKKSFIQRLVVDSIVSQLSQGDAERVFEKSKKEPRMYKHIIDYEKKYYKPNVKSSPPRSLDALSTINSVLQHFPDAIIVDSVVDSLTHDQFITLIEIIIQMYNSKELDKSMIAEECFKSYVRGQILFISSNKIQYYFDYFTNMLKCLRSGNTFENCDVIDMNDMPSNIRPDILKRSLKEDTSGYIALRQNKEPVFKIKELANKAGYVCKDQSTISIDYWKTKINDVIMKNVTPMIEKLIPVNSNITYHKPQLCYFYEILMRCFNETTFQRPLINLVPTKKIK